MVSNPFSSPHYTTRLHMRVRIGSCSFQFTKMQTSKRITRKYLKHTNLSTSRLWYLKIFLSYEAFSFKYVSWRSWMLYWSPLLTSKDRSVSSSVVSSTSNVWNKIFEKIFTGILRKYFPGLFWCALISIKDLTKDKAKAMIKDKAFPFTLLVRMKWIYQRKNTLNY